LRHHLEARAATRKDLLVEGACDRAGKGIWVQLQIASRIVVQQFEQRAEVIVGKIGMDDRYRPAALEAAPQSPHCN